MQRVTPRPVFAGQPTQAERDAFWALRREHYKFVDRVRLDATLIAQGYEIVPLVATQHVRGWEYAFDPKTMEAGGLRPENGAPVKIIMHGYVDDDGLTLVKSLVAPWRFFS